MPYSPRVLLRGRPIGAEIVEEGNCQFCCGATMGIDYRLPPSPFS